jgi:non-specific serine/threonine protein kinase
VAQDQKSTETTFCETCGKTLPHTRPGRPGRPARFCSDACRQRAHRSRAAARPPTARSAPAGNVRAALDSFVGREPELARIAELLRGARHLTLTGPGGQGKTRLALETLSRTVGRYPGGAWFAELGSVRDGGLVTQHVAAILGVRERPGTPVRESLAIDLAGEPALLVLDNCEHVVEAAAQLVAGLLESCPELRILCTSRESLELPGEVIYRVGELSLPSGPGAGQRSEVARSDAVRLFVERARSVVPGFELTAANAADVAAVCVRLDGSPLAIELAARRVRLLPVADILERLDDRFTLLTGGPRTAAARHRDLHAAIDWSYGLLTDGEQLLFRRLSVFTGRFAEDGAAAVCPELARGSVLELLGGLEAKSLIVADGDGWYRQLESIRCFASEMLAAAGEADLAFGQLAGWLVELAEPVLGGQRLIVAERESAALAEQVDTLVRAVEWSTARGDGRRVPLAAALGYGWRRRGHLSEGRRILHAALAETGPDSPGRTAGLLVAAVMAAGQSDAAASLALASEACAREESVLLARALVTMQIAQQRLGDPTAAVATAKRSVLAGRALRNPFDRAMLIHNVAYGALTRGDLAEAAALLDECFALYRGYTDRPIPPEWAHTAGALALARGDLDAAEDLLRGGLGGGPSSRPEVVVALLSIVEVLIVVAARRGDPVRALRLGGALSAQTSAYRLDSGEVWHEKTAVEALAEARQAVPSHQAEEAAGRRLDLAATIAYAVAGEWTGHPDDRGHVLTARELDVADHVAAGLTNRQIATRLRISERTVTSHLEHIRTKLGVQSRTLVVAWVLEQRAGGGPGQLGGYTPS